VVIPWPYSALCAQFAALCSAKNRHVADLSGAELPFLVIIGLSKGSVNLLSDFNIRLLNWGAVTVPKLVTQRASAPDANDLAACHNMIRRIAAWAA
jgi:hypothetical protein